MKKITMVMLGVLVSALTFAGRRADAPKTTSGMAVVKRDVDSYKLIYKSEAKSNVKIQILDASGSEVFSEVIRSSDGFIRPYNFSALGEGEYTIKVDNGSNWMSETVAYKSSYLDETAQLIRTQDGKYLLTVAGHGPEYLSVTIRNAKGDDLHSEISPVSGDFARVYNLEKLAGPFSFEVSDASGKSKVFEIDEMITFNLISPPPAERFFYARLQSITPASLAIVYLNGSRGYKLQVVCHARWVPFFRNRFSVL